MSMEEMGLLLHDCLVALTMAVSNQAGKDGIARVVAAQSGLATHVVRLASAGTAHQMGMITELGGNVLTGVTREV